MTLRDPPRDEPERARQRSARDRLLGIRRAAGLEAAGARQGRRNRRAVEADQSEKDPPEPGRGHGAGGTPHVGSRLKRSSISAETSASVARAHALFAIQMRQNAWY